ncbi:MAG: FAD-dependent oxidoreductase [Gluconacetobacter diazotrophicus]|nr:FAD-dependent oxidoreductase [Gluconacetobacter diazotrophicus]
MAVIESRHWGGTCVNLGCVPKKMMVMASEYGGHAIDGRGFGWKGVEPGRHDWGALIRAKDAEIARLNGVYTRMLGAAGVTSFTAHARFAGPHELVLEPGPLDEGFAPRRITAERVVIATGSRAVVQPHIAGWEHSIVSDQAFHLPDRPRRVTMVGSGYIGIEFAGIFAGLGSEVRIVARQDLPLRGFDHDLRTELCGAIAARGIEWHGNATVHRIAPNGGADGLRVTLGDGREWDTDCVFMAVGRRPNVDGLGLENTRVGSEENGRVVVDAGSETSEPGVYAIGDVTNRQNLTPVAIAEGHNLADRLFGSGSAREWSLDTVPKAVFFTPPLGSVGLTEDEAEARPNGADVYLTRFRPMRHTLSGRNRHTLMKLIVDRKDDRVLGAHMLGEDAPEIMQGLAVAVTAGLTKAVLDRTVGIHPTAAEEFVTLRVPTRRAGEA